MLAFRHFIGDRQNHAEVGISGDEAVLIDSQPAARILARVLLEPRALALEGPGSGVGAGRGGGGGGGEHSRPVLDARRVRPAGCEILDGSACLLDASSGHVVAELLQSLKQLVSLIAGTGFLGLDDPAGHDLARHVHGLLPAAWCSRGPSHSSVVRYPVRASFCSASFVREGLFSPNMLYTETNLRGPAPSGMRWED